MIRVAGGVEHFTVRCSNIDIQHVYVNCYQIPMQQSAQEASWLISVSHSRVTPRSG